MAKRVHTKESSLKLYVERAIPDADGNRIFESNPEEFVLFDGFYSTQIFGGVRAYLFPIGELVEVIYVSGYCKGATRHAGGHGSITAFLIGGLRGDEASGELVFNRRDSASGIVVPLARPNDTSPSWHRHPEYETAYLISDYRGDRDHRLNNRLRIITSKNTPQVSPDGHVHELTASGNDGLKITFDERTDGAEFYEQTDGTLPFEDFIFYGNYPTRTED